MNLGRTSIANIVAAVVIVGAGLYAFTKGDTQLMTFLAGASVGYLFAKAGVTQPTP